VQWSFDSKWFFLGAMVLGAVSLGLAIRNWRRVRRQSIATPTMAETGERSQEVPDASTDAF
jgi:hypothetical protein